MAISDKDRQVIDDAYRNGKYVYLTGDNLEIRFQTKIVAVKERHIVIGNSVTPQYIKQFLKSSNFYLQILLVNFKASSIDSDGKNIVIPIEESLMIKETRQSVRNEYFPNKNIHCQFTNPHDQRTLLRKRLMDLSDEGFSLVTFVETKLFSRGLEIKDIKFPLHNDKPPLVKSAKVRYIRVLVDIDGRRHIQVGFEFSKQKVAKG